MTRDTRHSESGSSLPGTLGLPFRWAWRACQPPVNPCQRGYPKPELFESKRHYKKAVRRAALKLIGRPPFLVAAGVAIVLNLAITLVLRQAVGSLGLPISQLAINLLLMVPIMIPCVLFSVWLMNRHMSRLVREELLAGGVPVCVECGYHLVGIAAPACPECGRELDELVQRILHLDTTPPLSE